MGSHVGIVNLVGNEEFHQSKAILDYITIEINLLSLIGVLRYVFSTQVNFFKHNSLQMCTMRVCALQVWAV